MKTYLQILVRKWWVVLPVFLIALVTTIVLTLVQTPVFEATATFIVKPNSSFSDEKSFTSGLDTLSRRTEIATTYTEVASSHLIKQEAATELGLSSGQAKSLSVDSRLRAGTNVLEVKVRGSDPLLARDFANAVGAQTTLYVQDLYETYDLRPLDQAAMPMSVASPNKKLNFALGAILGLILGAVLAFFAEYLQTPLERVINFDIVDDESSAYNKPYLWQRLGEEMNRAKRNRYPLSLASMEIDSLGAMNSSSPQVRSAALRSIAVLLKKHLRPEDVVARVNGSVFALLLPDLSGEEAREAMEKLQREIVLTPLEMEKNGPKLNLVGATGVVAYQRNGADQHELMDQATRAMERAKAADPERVCLLSNNESLHSDATSGEE